MRPASLASLAAVLCCTASMASAAGDLDPVVKAGAVDASHRNEAREMPACQVDCADTPADGRLHLRLDEPALAAFELQAEVDTDDESMQVQCR